MPPDAPSPLVINPAAAIQVPMNGGLFAAHANSGLMSTQPDLIQTFDLTFPDVGDYLYVCLVHGWMMSGTVHVVSPDVAIPSPNQSMAMGQQEIAAALAQVPAAMEHARQQIQPPTRNDNGTMTYHITMGYHEGQIDLMRFFPDKLVVHPGDTIVWEMLATNDAPHTVTFLNGAPGPDDFIPFPLDGGAMALYLNPEVLGPSQLSLVMHQGACSPAPARSAQLGRAGPGGVGIPGGHPRRLCTELVRIQTLAAAA